ncbi:glycosyltransferase [Mycoplasma corogypsi]|uniref:glycosyltransferase n=1 Tax=Mycoplasma corogypsi TaxID=2106 RepID=UPI003873B512
MKLSIISVVGNSPRDIEWYLTDLKEQDTNDFEVILCINKNSVSKEIYNIIQKFMPFFDKRLQVVYNTKINNFQHNLLSGFRFAKGDYVTVINSDVTLKKWYVSKTIEAAERHNVDILEFKPRIVGSIRFKPAARLKHDFEYEIQNSPEVIAYSFPFIFNKVFKKQLVKKMIDVVPLYTNDSKMCLFINYLLLINAKKYKYLDYRIWREYFGSDIWFNSKHFNDTFNYLEDLVVKNNCKLIQELKYARYYFIKLLLSGFLFESTFLSKNFKYFGKKDIIEKRSELLKQKQIELVMKIENSSDFAAFLDTNFYMLKNNDEVHSLKTPIEKLIKHGFLHEIQ